MKENVDYEHIDNKKINTQTEKIIDQLRLDSEELLRLALIKSPHGYEYPFCHSLNNCILSIVIGLALGYDKPKLMELGIAAILHDVGMKEYLDLACQPRKLSIKEYSEIKNHVIKSTEISKKICKDLPQTVNEVVLQHHERLDGSGYPTGLKGESINGYARILHITDAYEAMIHPRPHRKELLPLEALREILLNKNAFEYSLIKILIERIGVFPVGSLVELSTKEIAQVVKLNPKVCLRPVVEIIYDTDGEELKEPKTLDLAGQPSIYIKAQRKKSEFESI